MTHVRPLCALFLLACGCNSSEVSDAALRGDGDRTEERHVLLQVSRSSHLRFDLDGLSRSRTSRESPGVTVDAAGRPSVCDGGIVSASCRRFNGRAANTTTEAQIQDLLSIDDGLAHVVWAELGLSRAQPTCAELCDSVKQYAVSSGWLVPNSSDVGCLDVRGAVQCDVDLAPAHIVAKLEHASPVQPDRGAEDLPPPLGGASTDNDRGVLDVQGSNSIPHAHAVWNSIKLLANIFRFHPWTGGTTNSSGQEVSFLVSDTTLVETRNLVAQSYIVDVIEELNVEGTLPFRERWFGGTGALNASEVRQRIVQTMNFVDRELEGALYVYPADSASHSACGSRVLAYVWKFSGTSETYYETRGPVCDADQGWSKRCAVDRDGRYFVYLCALWGRSGESTQVSTMIHEATHHSGPRDHSYSKWRMKTFSQSKQLNNAKNYEEFSSEVVQHAWACAEEDYQSEDCVRPPTPAPPTPPPVYAVGNSGENTCPLGHSKITTWTECESAALSLDLPLQAAFSGCRTFVGTLPGGCMYYGRGSLGFVLCEQGDGEEGGDARPICVASTSSAVVRPAPTTPAPTTLAPTTPGPTTPAPTTSAPTTLAPSTTPVPASPFNRRGSMSTTPAPPAPTPLPVQSQCRSWCRTTAFCGYEEYCSGCSLCQR